MFLTMECKNKHYYYCGHCPSLECTENMIQGKIGSSGHFYLRYVTPPQEGVRLRFSVLDNVTRVSCAVNIYRAKYFWFAQVRVKQSPLYRYLRSKLLDISLL
jgi:hypothetical protein